MKKMAIALVALLAVTGMAVAQEAPAPWSPPGWNQIQATSVKVEGRLALINGMIGLKAGGKTYYLPMLERLAGFVESIKEGASVKVEGYEYPIAAAPEYSTVMVTKLTVGRKDYDLSQFAGYGMARVGRGGMMGGRRW